MYNAVKDNRSRQTTEVKDGKRLFFNKSPKEEVTHEMALKNT